MTAYRQPSLLARLTTAACSADAFVSWSDTSRYSIISSCSMSPQLSVRFAAADGPTFATTTHLLRFMMNLARLRRRKGTCALAVSPINLPSRQKGARFQSLRPGCAIASALFASLRTTSRAKIALSTKRSISTAVIKCGEMGRSAARLRVLDFT